MDCRFDKTRIKGASFGAGRESSEYVDCTFNGARITFGPGGYARFVRCSFLDVDLRDWFCFAVELVDCKFSGRLRRSWFNGTVPEDERSITRRDRNEFHGNDFSALDLVDVAFRTGIDLTKQRLPSGPEYLYLPQAAEAIERARRAVIGWVDLKQRQSAMRFIEMLQGDVVRGQQQLLLRHSNFGKRTDNAVDAVFALLGESTNPA